MTEETGNNGVAGARERVEAAAAPLTFEFDHPLKGIERLRGNKALFIAPTRDPDWARSVQRGVTEGLGTADVMILPKDTGGTSERSNELVRMAIAEGFDAVICDAVNTPVIEDSMPEAKAAGIPVVQLFEEKPGPPTPAQAAAGVYGNVTFDYTATGRLLADYAIADSDGKAKVIGVGAGASISASPNALAGMEERLGEYPGCTYVETDVPVLEWEERLYSATKEALEENRDASYVFPVFSPMTQVVCDAVRAVGLEDQVRLLSFGEAALPAPLLKRGEMVAAIAATSGEWVGWGAADMAMRGMLGEPAPTASPGIRLLTPDNIGEIDLSAPEDEWLGGVDFRARYRALWGRS